VVTNPREILDTSTADQHDGMLLQVVPDTGNIRRDLNSIRKSDTGNFT
jgi:hypothetical protein